MGKKLAAERLTSTKPNPSQQAAVGASAAVVGVAETVAVAAEDVTNRAYTAPSGHILIRGRE